MDVSSSIRAYRAKNLLAPLMHSILFTTVNCLHIFRKTTVWNHSQCLKINKNVLFNICRYFAFGLIILLTNRVHSKNALKFDYINDTFLSIFKHCVAQVSLKFLSGHKNNLDSCTSEANGANCKVLLIFNIWSHVIFLS